MGILIFRIKCILDCRWAPVNFMKLTVNQAAKFAFLRPKMETRGGSRTAVNYYHKALHLGCCSSPRSASRNPGCNVFSVLTESCM